MLLILFGLIVGSGFGGLLWLAEVKAVPTGTAEEDFQRGRLLIVIGLAFIVGGSALGGATSVLVAMASEQPVAAGVVRFLLTAFLAWLTFKGKRWAYLVLAILLIIGLVDGLFTLADIGFDVFGVLLLVMLAMWGIGLLLLTQPTAARLFRTLQQGGG